ncbi:MAG: DMT family transporter [Alphaproteobacteria bacterium]|nr:DMT family transporter [Alphaproteobacteria bacterium]
MTEELTTNSGARTGAGQATHARIALLALLIGAVVIGFSGILVKLSETGPLATAFYRVALSLPIFLLLMSATRRRPAKKGGTAPAGTAKASKLTSGDRWLLVLCGVLFAADLGIWHLSLQLTTVANATLLGNLAPIWVTLGVWLLFGERVRPQFIAGLVVAIVGCAIVMARSLSASPDNLAGDALAVLTTLFYGGYQLSVARLRASVSTSVILAWSGAVSAIIFLPVAVLAGETLLAQSVFGWGILLAIALISQAGGQGLITYAFAHLPASFSSVTLLIQPVAAAIFAWLILGEALGLWQGLGGAIVLLGIWLAGRGSMTSKTRW